MPYKRFELPRDLAKLPADLLRKILPDIAVKIIYAEGETQVSHCHRVTFDVILDPGLFVGKGNQRIEWVVIDKVNGTPETVADGAVYIPRSGGRSRVSVGFAMPPDATWTPDFSNEITVKADPHDMIAERAEANNTATFIGTCLG
jgi:hypothetical protein